MLSHFRIAIVGSGFSGLGMAIRLRKEGIDDFVVLERADDLGGTWRDNTYPGCQCDVPSRLYSFSFAPNPGWSRTYSGQEEIWQYLRDCARRYGVEDRIRYRHEVRSCKWDESSGRWTVRTTGGDVTAEVLVAGTGPLSEPAIPAIAGLETFSSARFHSANWDHELDLAGRRVAVIGTGSSAIQMVPLIQPLVKSLHLFQRTPAWILPHRDRPVLPLARRLYGWVPGIQELVRGFVYWTRELFVLPFLKVRADSAPEKLARDHLAKQVPDPELRARLTPEYAIGCKRILISNLFYPAIQQPNVELVTDAIREVRPNSIVTADGREHEVDAIILATGFRVTEVPFADRVRGRDGRLLSDLWRDGAVAYRGTTVAGFPNFFMLLGPNTGLGHTSVLLMVEAQIGYVMGCLRHLERVGAAVAEVKPVAQETFNIRIQDALKATVWNSGGCRSWYLTPEGKNTTIWPGSTWPYLRLMRRFDPAAYRLSSKAGAVPA